MKKQAKHEKLPWTHFDNGFDGYITNNDGAFIFGGEPSEGRIENDGDTKFMLKAVNSHYELVEALSCAIDYIDNNGEIDMEFIRQTIAKAKGRAK